MYVEEPDTSHATNGFRSLPLPGKRYTLTHFSTIWYIVAISSTRVYSGLAEQIH